MAGDSSEEEAGAEAPREIDSGCLGGLFDGDGPSCSITPLERRPRRPSPRWASICANLLLRRALMLAKCLWVAEAMSWKSWSWSPSPTFGGEGGVVFLWGLFLPAEAAADEEAGRPRRLVCWDCRCFSILEGDGAVGGALLGARPLARPRLRARPPPVLDGVSMIGSCVLDRDRFCCWFLFLVAFLCLFSRSSK